MQILKIRFKKLGFRAQSLRFQVQHKETLRNVKEVETYEHFRAQAEFNGSPDLFLSALGVCLLK